MKIILFHRRLARTGSCPTVLCIILMTTSKTLVKTNSSIHMDYPIKSDNKKREASLVRALLKLDSSIHLIFNNLSLFRMLWSGPVPIFFLKQPPLVVRLHLSNQGPVDVWKNWCFKWALMHSNEACNAVCECIVYIREGAILKKVFPL